MSAGQGNAPGQEGDSGQFLTFLLGGEMFMLGIARIKEIIEYRGITAVPMMPAFIRGVINLRGSVVPVVDLGSRFGRGGGAVTRRTCIVIIEVNAEGEHQDIGVVVDAVSEVMNLPSSDIEPAPAFGARIRADFVEGMARVNGRFVIVLNADRVLSVDDMAVLVGVSQTVEPVRVAAGQ